jgi:hypothetical protein
MKRFTALLVFLLLPFGAFAADAKKAEDSPKPPADAPKPAAEAPKAAEAPADAKVYSPTDLATLKPLKGQKIALEGKVANAGANKTQTIRYLNFTPNFKDSASLVFFANSGGGTFTKEKLAEFVGKTVRVTGTLSEYNGALQIRMESLDQMKVLEAPAAPATPPPAAK